MSPNNRYWGEAVRLAEAYDHIKIAAELLETASYSNSVMHVRIAMSELIHFFDEMYIKAASE